MLPLESTFLTCTTNGSNKAYNIHIAQEGSQYVVYAEYGGIGKNLRKIEKYRESSLGMAWNKTQELVDAKKRKGYVVDNVSKSPSQPGAQQTPPPASQPSPVAAKVKRKPIKGFTLPKTFNF